jgi:hypothetical protein
MLKYKLVVGGKELFVALDVERSHQSALIIYEGDSVSCGYVRSILKNQMGVFGHLISDSTTSIDLDSAMRSTDMQRFKSELIEGDELLQIDDSEVPDGSMS